ncbi:MAG: hypothetical protein IKD89_01000 [Clostridia bacterium]|nr:hypothetical protein [Clostridia bacterium]
MKKIILLTALILAAALCGCTDGAKNEPKNDTADAASIESAEGGLPVNETNDGVNIDDLLDCAGFLGLTPQEAGIPNAVIDDSSGVIIKTYADGGIFGVKDYAVIYFARGADGEELRVESVWIHVKGVGFDKCRGELAAKYGEPLFEGEEPYVEANGGAVMWAEFRDGDTVIRLSNASEREYDEIEIYKSAG